MISQSTINKINEAAKQLYQLNYRQLASDCWYLIRWFHSSDWVHNPLIDESGKVPPHPITELAEECRSIPYTNYKSYVDKCTDFSFAKVYLQQLYDALYYLYDYEVGATEPVYTYERLAVKSYILIVEKILGYIEKRDQDLADSEKTIKEIVEDEHRFLRVFSNRKPLHLYLNSDKSNKSVASGKSTNLYGADGNLASGSEFIHTMNHVNDGKLSFIVSKAYNNDEATQSRNSYIINTAYQERVESGINSVTENFYLLKRGSGSITYNAVDVEPSSEKDWLIRLYLTDNIDEIAYDKVATMEAVGPWSKTLAPGEKKPLYRLMYNTSITATLASRAYLSQEKEPLCRAVAYFKYGRSVTSGTTTTTLVKPELDVDRIKIVYENGYPYVKNISDSDVTLCCIIASKPKDINYSVYTKDADGNYYLGRFNEDLDHITVDGVTYTIAEYHAAGGFIITDIEHNADDTYALIDELANSSESSDPETDTWIYINNPGMYTLD